MATEILAEWMARIEYKVDLLLEERRNGRFANFTSLAAPRSCPACLQPISHQLHAMKKIVIRICGCRTGIVPPPDLEALAPPVTARGRNRGEPGDDEDDGTDSGSRSERRSGRGGVR